MRRNAEAAPNDRASVDLPEKNVKSRTTEARGVPIELPEEALAKFEAVTAAMPEIKKARRIREIDAAMEKGMSGFEERTADIVLEKQRIALAREADSRTNAIRERFKDARAPHDDAWEFLLELRKYEFELEEALEEARENSGLRDARKDIEALAAARKNVRDAIREIRSAVEKKEIVAYEETKEKGEDARTADAPPPYAADFWEHAKIRRELERGALNADRRGELEDKFQRRAEQIEDALMRIRPDELSKAETQRERDAALNALRDVRATLHALFEEDRRELREKTFALAGAPGRGERTPARAEDRRTESPFDSLRFAPVAQGRHPNAESRNPLVIPGDPDATRRKTQEIGAGIRDLLDAMRNEGARIPDLADRMAGLDRMEQELDERLERLWTKNEYSPKEKNEFGIIAEAKHSIQDLRHAFREFELQAAAKAKREGERDREESKRLCLKRKKDALLLVAREIIRALEQTGVKNPPARTSYLSGGIVGRTLRAAGAALGRKSPGIAPEDAKRIRNEIRRIETEFLDASSSEEERKRPQGRRRTREKSHLLSLSARADAYEMWNAVWSEIGGINKKLPTESEADFAPGAWARTREEPRDEVERAVETARAAGIKGTRKIIRTILDTTETNGDELPFRATEYVERLANLASAIRSKDGEAVKGPLAEVEKMNEILLEKGIAILEAKRLIERAQTLIKGKPEEKAA
jgi:hypothetical protein